MGPTKPKCERCRLNKKRCLPEERNWDRGEICFECMSRNAACGPPEIVRESVEREVVRSQSKPDQATAFGSTAVYAQEVPTWQLPHRASDSPSFPGWRTQQHTEQEFDFSTMNTPALPNDAFSGFYQPNMPMQATPARGLHRELPDLPPIPFDMQITATPQQAQSHERDLRSRFAHLIHFRGLFRQLRSLLAVLDRRRELWKTDLFDQVYSSIRTILNLCRRSFFLLGQQIREDIRRATGLAAELFSARLYERIKEFLDCRESVNIPTEDDRNYKDIEHLQRDVIQDRIGRYRDLNEDTEADTLLLELAVLQDRCQRVELDADNDTGETEAFIRQSESMNECYVQLNVEFEYADHLDLSNNIAPAAHLAADAGRPRVLWKIVTNQIHAADCHDLLGRRAIHLAVENENSEVVQLLLQQNPDTRKARDVFHMTPLSLAALGGQNDTFRVLALTKDDLEVRHQDSQTLLSMTASIGNKEIVECMFERYSTLPGHISRGSGPSRAAAPSGLASVTEEVPEPTDATGTGATKQAVDNMNRILANSAFPGDPPFPGLPPLHAAAMHGHDQVVGILLKNGASALEKYEERFAFERAKENGHFLLSQKLHKFTKAESRKNLQSKEGQGTVND